MKSRTWCLSAVGILLASLAAAACDGDDAVANVPNDGGNNGDVVNPNPDGGGDKEFAQFVKDLILNETKDNNKPVDLATAPAKDTEPKDVFEPAFFK
ncbi:MAG: hypothetical protein HOO96_17080 [Polyangiaceae bacterium]|nr:hypothetical protein [Polyangiaceae bacterium]